MGEEEEITIITPAHNEEECIEDCILSIKALGVPDGYTLKHVVVLDRCTDRTEEICTMQGVPTVRKDWRGEFVSSIAEAVDAGIRATRGEIIGKVDADVRLPRDTLKKLIPHLGGQVACVSADARTRTGRWLDVLFKLRDVNYRIAPLGREPRGCCRLFSRAVIEEVGGLDPLRPTFDTALDMRLRARGYESIPVPEVVVTEFRSLSLMDIIRHQMGTGRARRKLGVSFLRTLLHSIFRLRPFVLVGYLLGAIGC